MKTPKMTPEQERYEEQMVREFATCWQRANAAAAPAIEGGEGPAVIENVWATAFEEARKELGY